MILFYIREAFRIFKRSAWSSFIVIGITSLAIILSALTIFSWFATEKISTQIKSSIEINVYLADSLNAGQIELIHNKLLSYETLSSVKYLSKEDAVKEFIKETGEDFIEVLDDNPLPHSFVLRFKPESIKSKPLQEFVLELKKINGVTEVIYDYVTTLKLLNIFENSSYILLAISCGFIALSIYMVYSNYKVLIVNSKNLYKTMKYVGTTERSMKIPILINGIVVGFLSALLVIGFYNLIIILLKEVFKNLHLTYHFYLFNFLILGIGLALGFTGSFLSSRTISSVIKEKIKIN